MNDSAVVREALTLTDPADRAAFLDRACAGRSGLRREVEAALAALQKAADVLDDPGPPRTWVVVPDPPPAPPAAGAGTVVAGRYRLLEPLGQGGMGTVWKAEQSEPVRRTVALKLVRAGLDSLPILTRFEAERQALALMDHPNIARVFDAGTTADGRPFFVMELVDGVPITQFCDDRRLTPRGRLELFVPVCLAVQHAHQKGVLHRDLKPSNVLVAEVDGRPVPKVIDFGLAKATAGPLTDVTVHTAAGAVVGTPAYMSPEQATLDRADVDTRTDVYGLGVLLYELLTGTTPVERARFRAAALAEMLRVVREEEPPRPSQRLSTAEARASLAAVRGTEPDRLSKLLRGEVDWIVMKALEKDRERRYESAGGFAADVRRYLAGEPVLAHPPSTAYRLKKFVRRHRGPVAAAGLVLLALVAGVVGTSVGLVRAEEARRREAERAEGERRAKAAAEAAAAAEAGAKERAEKRLGQLEKAADVLGSIFADLDPTAEAAEGRPLRAVLADRLDKAVAGLDADAVGDPLVVAGLQGRLGLALLGLGEPEKAVGLLEKARDTCLARHGPDHPDSLRSGRNLAAGYRALGKTDVAVRMLEENHRRTATALGPDHPATLESLHGLAAAHHTAGRFDRAVPLYEECLRRFAATVGPDHPDAVRCRHNLGVTHQSAGRPDLAVPLQEECLRVRTATLGPDHPSTLASRNGLAEGYRRTGRPELALPLQEEGLRRTAARFGPDHPHTLTSTGNLAKTYLEAGRAEHAARLFETFVPGMRARLAKSPLQFAGLLTEVSADLVRAGQYAAAEPYLVECVGLHERGGADGWYTSHVRALLGASLLGQGKYAAAERALRDGYRGMREREAGRPAVGRWAAEEAADRLVELYAAWGKPAEAAKWRAERAKYPSPAPAPRPAVPNRPAPPPGRPV